MSTIFAALWLADNVGSFREGGGAAFYHSPIQPQPVENSCRGWATWSNFVADKDYNITGYTSLYYAARLINLEWVQHRSGSHQMFPSSTKIRDGEGNSLVTSYAVYRPDGNWSLLLVNRDESRSHTVRIAFEVSRTGRKGFFSGHVAIVTFGSEEYEWRNNRVDSHADPDGPPVGSHLTASPQTRFTLPRASLTVLRGRVGGLAQ
jgi:hypothetical protein